MRRRPPTGMAIALSLTKSFVLLAVVALCFGLVGRGDADPVEQPPATRVDGHAPAAAVARAMDRHDCSEAGFDPEIKPRSALIRRDGAIRHVSFDEGWAVFTEHRPGTLLALCLDDYRSGD